MADPKYTDQKHVCYGDDGTTFSVPDDVSFGTCDITSEERDKSEKFHIRLNVANTGAKDTAVVAWSLYYNTSPSMSGATQVTTSSANAVQIVASDDADLAAADLTQTNKCGATGTWQDGEYVEDPSTTTLTQKIPNTYYTEFQFCVQFTANASYDQTYYFMVAEGGASLDTYSVYGQVACIEVVGDRSVNIQTEVVSVDEDVTVSLPDALDVSVQEGIVTVTDVPEFEILVEGNVFDAVGVTEDVTVELPDALQPSVFDAPSLEESVTASLPDSLEISVFDATTGTDVVVDVALTVADLEISVYDTVVTVGQIDMTWNQSVTFWFGVAAALMPAAGDTIEHDATSADSTTGTDNLTVPHTVAGTNRIILVTVMHTSGSITLDAATYAGQNLTELDTQDYAGTARVRYLYRIAPTTGNNNVYIECSSPPSDLIVVVNSYEGVDQSTPFGDTVKGSGSGAPSLTVSAGSGQMVVDGIGAVYTGTMTPGANQTARGQETPDGNWRAMMSEEPGAGGEYVAVTVSEKGAYEIDVFDAAGVAEDVTAELPDSLVVSVYDSAGVVDEETVELPDALEVSAYDSPSLDEDVSVEMPDALELDVFDASGITENVGVELPDSLVVDVYDSAGVSEDKTVSIGAGPTLEIDVYDEASVTEDKTVGTSKFYWTDFHEYTTGLKPSDWTEKLYAGGGDFVVQSDGQWGGKCGELSHISAGRYFIAWNDVGSPYDAEVLMKARATVEYDHTPRIAIRGQGSDSNEVVYFCGFQVTQNEIFIHKYTPTSTSVGTTAFSCDINEWYWMRFRIEGTSLKLKAWHQDDQEPAAWMIEQTDTSITTAGWVGVGGYNDGADVDFFSVATRGATAQGLPLKLMYDSVTVTDVVDGIEISLAPGPEIDVYETVGVTEDVSLAFELVPNVFAEVTVSEYVDLAMELVPSVFDTVGVTEDVTVETIAAGLQIDVFDSVTIQEWNDLALELVPNVFDLVGVTEAAGLSLSDLAVDIYDSAGAGEWVDLAQELVPSVFDTVGVDESVSLAFSLSISVFDSITVTESVVSFLADLEVSSFDSVTVLETTAEDISDLQVDVFQSVTVAGEPTVLVEVEGELYASVFETVAVTESVSGIISAVILSTFDSVAVTDAVEVAPELKMSVYDSVSLSEDVTVTVSSLQLYAFDSISLTEDVTVDVLVPEFLEIDTYEAVSVTESTAGIISAVILSTYDTVAVTESVGIYWLIAAGKAALTMESRVPDVEFAARVPDVLFAERVPDVDFKVH